MNTPIFKRGDIVLIVSLAVIAAVLMAWNTCGIAPGRQVTAIITQDGKLIKKINLSELRDPEYVYIDKPVKQVILAEKGRIRFLKSDCPNKICVKTGWLTKAGNKAICMPSRVVITIVGDHKQVDSVSY